MSLFSRFTGSSTSSANCSNRQDFANHITQRRKISAVSTQVNGEDGLVTASPRNCYQRTSGLRQKREIEEVDGGRQSILGIVAENGAEIVKKENERNPHAISSTGASSTTAKKSRTSTSSLASVFRTRAASPIERVRKFISRSSSTSKTRKPLDPPIPSPIPLSTLEEFQRNEDRLRIQLEDARIEIEKLTFDKEVRNKKEYFDVGQQSEKIIVKEVSTMTENWETPISSPRSNKENENPMRRKIGGLEREDSPDVICLDDLSKMRELEGEVAKLRAECAEQKADFRQTRKDFILILREAVIRKNEAEMMYAKLAKSLNDDEDWSTLMSQHRHTLRRNVLLLWVQKKLASYHIVVNNFSSDWTDCRAFCALIYELFPSVISSNDEFLKLDNDCVIRCREAFRALEIPFDEKGLGVNSGSPTTDDSCEESTICNLPDWRYIMDTVFQLYKRSTLGK